MKLSVSKRCAKKKSTTNFLRAKGDIPAILYGAETDNQLLAVKGSEFNAILKKIPKGNLSTTVFILDGEGFSVEAILKDVQYNVTNYDVIHLDFLLLNKEKKINVNVPVRFTSVADCVGIKQGGFVRQVMRSIRVRCSPKKLPKEFSLDVKDLGMRQSKRVQDVQVPDGVEILAPLNEVVVVIAKR